MNLMLESNFFLANYTTSKKCMEFFVDSLFCINFIWSWQRRSRINIPNMTEKGWKLDLHTVKKNAFQTKRWKILSFFSSVTVFGFFFVVCFGILVFCLFVCLFFKVDWFLLATLIQCIFCNLCIYIVYKVLIGQQHRSEILLFYLVYGNPFSRSYTN